ncbi:membrane protein [Beggiatoa sp. PS]|nr:membrane protein [Beggiatoa sp. PS]
MRQYKEQAIKKAWEQERELVSFADIGTRDWTLAEKKELLETGRIRGYEGRYINKKIEDNPRLATNADNVVFAKVDETYLPKELLQSASLRSYTIAYEENKYSLWGGFILTILILTVAFQKKRGIIIYPAIAGAVLGAVRMGIISGGSIKAIIAGLASGLIIGTLAGIFIFLIVISGGVG